MSEVVDLAVELKDDAMVTSSPDAGTIFDPLIDKLAGQLAITRAEVVALTAKVSDMEDARREVEQEHEDIVKKMRKETKKLKDLVIAEYNGASSPYHGVLRSIRGIVKVADDA